MKNGKNTPVCKIEIVNEAKVKEAQKSLSNNPQILDMVEIFKLLGESTRLKIILSLIDNELCVCDLSAVTDSTISAVSHQLRLLRNARLVKFRKEGKMVFYSIDDEHIYKLIEQVKEHVEE
ncbi:MAG: metalloregulator ArsR/SmtB family transcription factor [Melioribacteraceae bacterium]|nr:metalloregulator ArsR/SmtB family transcription factor [Melioribacteraceae bacterium]